MELNLSLLRWRFGLKLVALASMISACGSEGVLEVDPGPTPIEPSAAAGSAVDLPKAQAEAAGPKVAPGASSPCQSSQDRVFCPHLTRSFEVDPGIFRDVQYALPLGETPAQGWPVVIFFQGSFFSSERIWDAESGLAFGAFHLVRTFDRLLSEGFAIVAPEAHLDGSTFWDTNVPPWSVLWESSPDHRFMLRIFEAIETGELGALDSSTLYATGISSGGYMTSRMAVAYADRFKALAVHSASYATCSGALCIIPDLPSDHPPTLLLHGAEDLVVPIRTMRSYEEALESQGTPTRAVVNAGAGHEWLEEAESELPLWFSSHP